MNANILVVEDDRVTQQMMRKLLREKFGYSVEVADNGKQALRILNQHNHDYFSALLLDIQMPQMDGFEVLEYAQKRYKHIPTIMLTSIDKPETIVKAIKLGAYEYLNKPIDPTHLRVVLHNAVKKRETERTLSRIQRDQTGELHFSDLVGYQTGLANTVSHGLKAATSQAPVMITGETGVGKELFARAIHGESNRAGKPFIAVNCGAIPEKLVESILFGHEKGAFTGATEKTLGKFREADGGTIFLDELGELPLAAQVKLLRVLQEKAVEPVGGKVTKIDVRIISATNRQLEQEITQGNMREDIYFRLNVLPIYIPPLRERSEDIIALAEYFLQQASIQDSMPLRRIDDSACYYLTHQDWPGNIRELANLMRRASIWCNDEVISDTMLEECNKKGIAKRVSHTDQLTTQNNPSAAPIILLHTADGVHKTMEDIEKELIQTVLKLERNNITHAATKLGIAKSTFYRKMKQFSDSK